MHSNRSEHSRRRQHGDRSSRQWDDYDDRWDERCEPLRDEPRDSYHKYGGSGNRSTERTNRSKEYSDSPKRLYSKDSVSRDWSRKSPVRRRMSSPDWGAVEKKRRRFTEDAEDDYKYRHEPKDKTYRQSPDSVSHLHIPKDFKHTPPQEEDFKYRKTSQDSSQRHRYEKYTYRQHHDYRLLSGYYKDRDCRERSWDRSEERTRLQEHSAKSGGKPRERDDSPSTDHVDHRQNRTRFPLNESSGQSFESDVTNRSPTVAEQKSTKGFQRFLDVLNKGVNVAMLTKIVTQSSPEISDQPRSPSSFMNTADCLWSPSFVGIQQGSHQNNRHWGESETSQRLASPQPPHRSFSPRRSSLSDETSLQRSDGGRSYEGLNGRSNPQTAVGKMILTPEDEHKHRQMQDVLQAIGLDLGSEELGQMSNRIQERLYGKKESGQARHRRGSRERDTRQAFSPRHRSRSSSSSRSNFSSLTRDTHWKKDLCGAQRDVIEAHELHVHQAVEYGQNGSSSSLQDSEKCETDPRGDTAALQTFSSNTTYSLSEPSLTPVMPMYSPVNCSPLPYSALPPALPANLPRVGPGLFLPRLPPFLPYPHTPPLNMFPAVLTQTRHLLPQQISNPQSPFINLPNMNPIQPLNTTQKSKTPSRPRCLQVIETKQPG